VHKIADHYPENELIEAFSGQDVVVSTIGVPAVKAGVRRFLPAEFGGNKENPKVASLPLFGAKQEVLAYLKSKESDQFSWTGIATGPFLDWWVRASNWYPHSTVALTPNPGV
jgi:NmrA-like family